METAGQVHDFIQEAHNFYVSLRHAKPKVVLVHAGPHLLPEIGPELGGYAQRLLTSRGVDVRLNTQVAAMTARQVLYAGGGGIGTNTIITTIGNAPNPVVLDLCRQLGLEPVKGRVPTDAALRVTGQSQLWAAGDGAAVPWNDKGEKSCRPPPRSSRCATASSSGGIWPLLCRAGKSSHFRYRYRGQLANIGKRAAVAELFGLRFRGFIAWWIWRTIYLAKLPGASSGACGSRSTGPSTFIFPRDISVLLPRPDEVMRSAHLEKDEVLFTAGDPCRAYFYMCAAAP